ncbi:hypothetical protein Tco_1360504 [Tanacetum coccineum]
MTSKAQQSELDNALVAPENRRVIGKCNMRINPGMKPKEPTYQVELDTLALTTCYPAFLITAEVPVIYMHQFWATVTKHKASYRFKINNKKFFMNVEVFRDILNICPRIPGKEFDEPPSEEEALSFIRELGHSGEIEYITDVIVDHLHQPWRTFASIINKCLFGKTDNMDSKKQDKMFYLRFMKIIIYHFLDKDKSISMRNKMFMHTAHDDSLLGTMRFISRHVNTQVYGAILPKEMTNQALLDSLAYKTYYAIASGAEPPKSRKSQKKLVLAISSKESPSKKKYDKAKKVDATKPKPTKKKAPVKADKGTGLNVLSEVALSEADLLKEATKRSKKDFHISHASGSGDGTDFELGVPDEQHLKTYGADEGTGTKSRVPYVPKYDSESEKESWGDSGEEDDDDEDDTEDDEENDDSDANDDDDNDDNDGDDDDNDANDDDNQEDDDKNDDEEETNSDRTESNRIKILVLNQSTTEYYKKKKKKRLMMKRRWIKKLMRFEQVKEDAHVTLTSVIDTQKTDEPEQSSSVSSDFTSKLLNLENTSLADNEIASLMDTTVCHEEPGSQTSSLYTVPITAVPVITSIFTTTTHSPPHFFNPLLQQATTTPIPTISEAVTSFPSLPNFSFVFKFNDRVTNLEKDLSEIKQVDQYAQALSSILAIVDRYIDNKLGEAIQKAIVAHNLDCREEAQAEKRDYIELIDASMRAILKEEVNTQLPQILPQAVSDFATPRSRDDETKIKTPSLDQTKGQKEGSQARKLSHPEIQEEPSHTVDDSREQQNQEFDTGNNDEQPANKEVSKADWFKKLERPPTLDPDWNKRQHVDSMKTLKAQS